MAKRDTHPIDGISGADVSGALWRFMKIVTGGAQGGNYVRCDTAGEAADGVMSGAYPDASRATAAGFGINLDIDKITKIEAGAAITAGADITTDNVGRGVTAGAGDNVNGTALEAATAAGQIITIRTPYSRSSQLVGTIANGAVSPAVLVSSAPTVLAFDIPDAATTTYSYINGEKFEIIDVKVIKDTAGAGNTIQIKNAGGTAISDAIAAAVDKTVTRAGTLDKATRTLAASAGFQITATRAAGSMACQVFVEVIKRA